MNGCMLCQARHWMLSTPKLTALRCSGINNAANASAASTIGCTEMPVLTIGNRPDSAAPPGAVMPL